MQQLLPYLAFLACPIGMGLMMWVMMRARSSSGDQRDAEPDPRISELESQVNELKAELRGRDRDAATRR